MKAGLLAAFARAISTLTGGIIFQVFVCIRCTVCTVELVRFHAARLLALRIQERNLDDEACCLDQESRILAQVSKGEVLQ